MTNMKDSGIEWIGQIPSDWELKTIKQLLIERCEKNSALEVNTILSLSAKDGVTLYIGENHSGNKPREDLSDYKIVRPNDIVVNSMNILSGSVGMSHYLGVVSPVYYAYYPRFADNVSYLYRIFQSKEFQLSLRGLGNGILIKETEDGKLNTIRMRIPSKKLNMQVLPHPPIPVQNIIDSFLKQKTEQIDELISNQEQQIEKLKAYKQAVITEAVTHGLDSTAPMKDSGELYLGQVPKHWVVKKLKYIADSFYKGSEITKEQTVENGDTPCVRYGELYTKYNYVFSECVTRTNANLLSSPQYFSYGDVLFTCTGELVEEIGKSIAYLGHEECLAGGDIVIMKHKQNPIFMGYALSSFYAQEQRSRGKTKLKVVHTSASAIGNTIFLLPPLDEQNRIADFIESKCVSIDRLVAIKQQKIEKLNAYKKSLIYEYVTGKNEVV